LPFFLLAFSKFINHFNNHENKMFQGVIPILYLICFVTISKKLISHKYYLKHFNGM
jgi:hypothetical protein